MVAKTTGRVTGKVVTLDESVPSLEGRRVRILLEDGDDEEARLSSESQAALLREWAEHGPQGPIDQEADDLP